MKKILKYYWVNSSASRTEVWLRNKYFGPLSLSSLFIFTLHFVHWSQLQEWCPWNENVHEIKWKYTFQHVFMHKYSLYKIRKDHRDCRHIIFSLIWNILWNSWKILKTPLGVSWCLGFEILMIKNKPKLENEIFLILKWPTLQKVNYQV